MSPNIISREAEKYGRIKHSTPSFHSFPSFFFCLKMNVCPASCLLKTRLESKAPKWTLEAEMSITTHNLKMLSGMNMLFILL